MRELICILGTEYRMRVELAAYLARNGWDEEDGPVGIMLPPTVLDDPGLKFWLPTAYEFELIRAEWREDAGWSTDKDLDDFSVLLLIPDRAISLVDQMEVLKDWLHEREIMLGRIFTVVDCNTLQQYPQLQEWYDACIHFSDGVLLGNRSVVGNKWVKDYETRFNKRRIPCLLGYLKAGGKIDEVEEWLFPDARRLSQYFDEQDEALYDEIAADIEIEDGDLAQWVKEMTEGDSDAGDPDADLYLARNEMGFRKLPIHDFSVLWQQLPH